MRDGYWDRQVSWQRLSANFYKTRKIYPYQIQFTSMTHIQFLKIVKPNILHVNCDDWVTSENYFTIAINFVKVTHDCRRAGRVSGSGKQAGRFMSCILCTLIRTTAATLTAERSSVHLLRANLVKSACVKDWMFLCPITKVRLLHVYDWGNK